jgi:hypothetical protein
MSGKWRLLRLPASRLQDQRVSFKGGSKSDPLPVKPDGTSFIEA